MFNIIRAIIHANKQGEMDFMLEVFSRDRNTDFEFFEFIDDEIKYKTKDVYDIDSQTKTIYRSLGNGTIILNGIPITIDNVSEEQIEYINNIVELHKEKYLKKIISHDLPNTLLEMILLILLLIQQL